MSVCALWARGLPWTLECLSLARFLFLLLSSESLGSKTSGYPPTENTHSQSLRVCGDLFGLPVLNVHVLCVYFMLL